MDQDQKALSIERSDDQMATFVDVKYAGPCIRGCGPRRLTKGGFVVCDTCNRNKAAKWYTDNPEKAKAQRVASYQNNKEKIKLRSQRQRTEQDPFYARWKAMNRRCHDGNDKDYRNYGARNISVSPLWRWTPGYSKEITAANKVTFEAYKVYVDEVLGPKPGPGYSIDRIENNGNYEPGNIRWSDATTQNNNTRTNVHYKSSVSVYSVLDFEGRLVTLLDISRIFDIPLDVVKYRYCLNPFVDLMLDDTIHNRLFEYRGRKYSLSELPLMSSSKYSTIRKRIMESKWSVEDAVDL